jgi:hypothetical protein
MQFIFNAVDVSFGAVERKGSLLLEYNQVQSGCVASGHTPPLGDSHPCCFYVTDDVPSFACDSTLKASNQGCKVRFRISNP